VAASKAAGLAKSMVLGRAMKIGERYSNRPLIWPMLHRAFACLVLLVALTIIEKVLVGLFHHQPVAASLNELIGIRWWRSGTTGQPRRRMDSMSGPEVTQDRAAPSTPNTARPRRGALNARVRSLRTVLNSGHISVTMSETPQVLDGLHHHAHQTDLRIVEHYTDTAGTTDHVFGLCHLLGHRFAPRIKDLKDRKLYTVEKPGTWPLLAPLIGDTVETAAILGQWIKLIRLKASIETGAVGPSVILRKLAAAGADNVLSRPLRAPGRIERTLSPCNGYPIRRCANAAMPVSPRARPASCLRPSEASFRHINQSPCHRLQGR
jgi:hypothetical protein